MKRLFLAELFHSLWSIVLLFSHFFCSVTGWVLSIWMIQQCTAVQWPFFFGARNILSSIHHAYNIQLSQNWAQLKFYAIVFGVVVMLITCLIINGSTGCKLHMWTIRSRHKQYINFAHRVLRLVAIEGKQLQCTPLNPSLFML
jgi:hypothetical protein